MKNKIKEIVVKLNLMDILSLPFYLFRIFKIKNNKIACTNFSGKGYGDNTKYVVQELLKHKDKYDIVWFVSDKNKYIIPSEIRVVKLYSLKWFYELATAKIWINNSRFPIFVKKRKNQYYIQTWHGGLGLKKIEKDAEETLSNYYKKSAKRDSKMIDLMISNSDYRTNLFKKSFWYNGKILDVGSPRNDIFFSKEEYNKLNEFIREKYNIGSNKKIVLYAPTYRKNTEFNYYSIDYDNLINQLYKRYNEEYVFLIKLHPKFSNKVTELKSDKIIDVTNYPDVDELLLITDILISDYSSVFFDFLYTNKPVYLYAPDYKEYLDERGMNFVYSDLPFSISYSNEELINKIILDDSSNYNDKLKEFIMKMGIKDKGVASKSVVNVIDTIINGGNLNE